MTVAETDTVWLAQSGEPWTAYRTLLDLDHRRPSDPAVESVRRQVIKSPAVLELVGIAGDWPGYALKRHNDAVRADPRLTEMVEAITSQADGEGRYTASSMYRSWRQWSFADKRQPSPWITMLVLRIQDRMSTL